MEPFQNQHAKLSNSGVCENREQMIEKAMSFMTRLSSWPERVRAYFQHPSAKYAAQPI